MVDFTDLIVIIVLVVVLLLVTFIPQLSTFLPNALMGATV